jgi:hypothetical protein
MIDLESIGIRVGFLVAGLFGAVLMTTKRAAATIGQTTLSIVGGAASANYMTPIVLKITKLDPNDSGYAIAFLLGFAGLRDGSSSDGPFLDNARPLSRADLERE